MISITDLCNVDYLKLLHTMSCFMFEKSFFISFNMVLLSIFFLKDFETKQQPDQLQRNASQFSSRPAHQNALLIFVEEKNPENEN